MEDKAGGADPRLAAIRLHFSVYESPAYYSEVVVESLIHCASLSLKKVKWLLITTVDALLQC